MKLSTSVLSLSLLLLTGLAAAQGTVYRWVDKSGQTHYSQVPPGGRNYDVIQGKRAQTATPESRSDTAETEAVAAQQTETQRFIKDAEAARKAKADDLAKTKQAKAEAKQKCAAARERATFLEERTGRRLVIKAEDGNMERMPEDEFLKRLDAAKKEISANCGP